MSCQRISYPSTQASLGYGVGGLGGRFSGFPVGTGITLEGVQVVAQIGVPLSTAPGPRTFVIAGIDQTTIAAGMVMLPTSEDIAPNLYVIGTSQFYTIGEVHWNGAVQLQGTAWEFVEPFRHIIRLLVNPAGISTPVRFIYYGWDIGVRTGFIVASYPVAFAFVGTRILAEQVPPANQFFTVNYTVPRRGVNPTTMFARYPEIIDDLLPSHVDFDGISGFETYRPAGYRVFDTTAKELFRWDGMAWDTAGTFSAGTKFYVKRNRAVYQFDGNIVHLLYTAGDPLTLSIPEALSYPVSPISTELFGESIGKNFLQDAFSPNAPTVFPSAYMIGQRPGDYDDWIAAEFG